jgi:hypothetical protein
VTPYAVSVASVNVAQWRYPVNKRPPLGFFARTAKIRINTGLALLHVPLYPHPLQDSIHHIVLFYHLHSFTSPTMATSKDRGDYKNVLLEEQDAVELRKAIATGSVEEPLVSSASA